MFSPELHPIRPPLCEVPLPSGLIEVCFTNPDDFDFLGHSLEQLTEAASLMRTSLVDKYSTATNPDNPPVDEQIIELTVSELLGNAARYANGARRAFIGTDPNDAMIYVGVEDKNPFWVEAKRPESIGHSELTAYSPAVLDEIEHRRGMDFIKKIANQMAYDYAWNERHAVAVGKVVWARFAQGTKL